MRIILLDTFFFEEDFLPPVLVQPPSIKLDLPLRYELLHKISMNFRSRSILVNLAIFVTTLNSIFTWDLLPLGIGEDARLVHVSIHFIRAFLCIKIPKPVNNLNNQYDSAGDNYNNNKNSDEPIPTLIEVPWPENLLPIRPKFFPNSDAHARTCTGCEKIIQAKWTEIDSNNRLWLVDAGNEFCPPKLIIYDLIMFNKEFYRIHFNEFQGNEIVTMKIDPESPKGQTMAYFSLEHGEYLIMFNLHTRKYSKLPISIENNRKFETGLVSSSSFQLNTNNVHKENDETPIVEVHTKQTSIKIFPHEIAFTLDHRLYISDKSGNLFVAHLNSTLNGGNGLEASHLGSLLGPPKGLITDSLGNLYYILPKDGVILRWKPSNALNAEGHEILYFNSLPIAQIVFGFRGSVWAATESKQILRDHCYKILYHFSANSDNI